MSADLKGITSSIHALVVAPETIPVRQQIIELQSDFMILQGEHYELIEENRELRAQIKDIKEKLALSSKIKLASECYLLEMDGVELPICMNCWDTKKIPIRLSVDKVPPECPNCKNWFSGIDDKYLT